MHDMLFGTRPATRDDSMEVWRLARIGDWSLTSRQSPIPSPGLDVIINADCCARTHTSAPPTPSGGATVGGILVAGRRILVGKTGIARHGSVVGDSRQLDVSL